MKRSLLIIIAMTIMLSILATCSTMPENEIATVTPTETPTATVQATVTPEATETPQTSDIPEISEKPAKTADRTVEPTEMVDQSAAVAPTSTADSDAQGTASITPEPSATGPATVKPTSTQKPTATVKPTATKTATKTATPKPTATAQKDVYQTIEFEGKTYKVLMGRNGNPNLIKDYSTLPKTLQAYAYPTFDKNAVMMDIYKYAKTKGFKYFSNPNVPLLKESSIGYNEYPEGFTPGGNMNETLAKEAFSWYSPSIVSYLGDSAYTGDYEYTELDDIISLRKAGFSKVDFLATRNKDCLCLWIQDYGDSSNRKDYWDNGLYNGKVTKEYALYFMYGGRDDLLQEVQA